MTTDVFIDTNVLIYAFARGDPRSLRARGVLTGGGKFSTQVANEFIDVGRRRLRWSWPEASEALSEVRHWLGPPFALTVEIHERGLRLASRHDFRIYDGTILAAAAMLGCRTLLTEDLTHGQVIDGVGVRNPFL